MIDELYNKMKDYDMTNPLQLNLLKIGGEKQNKQFITANEWPMKLGLNWLKLILETEQKRNKNEKLLRA